MRWEIPRQLIEVKGEPIVARTIRLLQECGVEDIAISSNHQAFEAFGVPMLMHDNDYLTKGYNKIKSGTWVNAFYPTDEPACYLFGDVIYSPAAIRTIVETETDDIQFFASKRPFAPEYSKSHVEPFGFKVVNQKHLHEAIEEVKRLDKLGAFARQPIAWELWYLITGSPTKQDAEDIKGKARNYVAINDYTCDIDDTWEIESVLRNINEL